MLKNSHIIKRFDTPSGISYFLIEEADEFSIVSGRQQPGKMMRLVATFTDFEKAVRAFVRITDHLTAAI